MDVHQAIQNAEQLLSGQAAPEGQIDPRWQAIIEVSEFIDEEPDAVWRFIERWGGSPDGDLRAAIATCLLEHLLESHFETFFPRVEAAVHRDSLFAAMFRVCFKFGESTLPENSRRFDARRTSGGA